MSCKLFISHAAADVDKVTPIVDCITACFEISNEEIMYTSSLTKGIRNGKDFNKELREAIQESDLVIVFLSANYIKSQYCLIELGATWGNNKKHFIIKENRDISFHELSIFSTTTQDNLSDETIAKLHQLLANELKIKQKLINFIEILEQCKKAAKAISDSSTPAQEQLQRPHKLEDESTRVLDQTDGLKIFQDHYTADSARLKQAKNSVYYYLNTNTNKQFGNAAFQIIEQQYKNIKHFLKQYATSKEDIEYLSVQKLGKFGDFYTAFRTFILNIDLLKEWYNVHQQFRNDYEFCLSEYDISKEIAAKNPIDESENEKLAAIFYIIRHSCTKISTHDKKLSSQFLSNRENKLIAAVLTSDISKGIKSVLISLLTST